MKDQRSKTKCQNTFTLRLTKFELLHLRDLFNVCLPPEMSQTVSQALAASEGRSMVEPKLWQKIVKVCNEAELPMDEDAPDFVVSIASVPSIGVFQVPHDPTGEDGEAQEGDASALFGDDNDPAHYNATGDD